MDQTISELQKRRADNIIWNCANDYSFAPDFKAYDVGGGADIYWNVIIGAARRRLEYEKLETLFAMLDSYRDAAAYETLVWNALEPVLFRKEREERPVLERLRPAPAEGELRFEDGTERVLNILGLWDFDEELCVISAHAPLAQLVIGRKAGDSVSVPDPDFDGEYLAAEIVSVGPLPPEVLAWSR